MSEELCPCGSGKPYSKCCEPIIKKIVSAATPEILMRSRYSAYVKHEISWLKESLLPSEQKAFDKASVLEWSNSTWLDFKILKTKTDEKKNLGWVEFITRFKQGTIARDHHELSEFHKVEGKWFFFDGQAVKPKTIRNEKPEVGRNDPCPCGSGKKYKKCCGKNK